MSEALLLKRKFLVACPDEDHRKDWCAAIALHVDRASFVMADDGLQALQKAENDIPHVVVALDELPKLRGTELAARLLRDHPKTLSFILLADIPESHDMADAVATGQLQYLSPRATEAQIGACLARALNWLSRGDKLEFNVRFLASGEYLMRQGDVAESVYILKRGSMTAFANANANADATREQIGEHGTLLGDISAKEFVGEMAYINGDVRSADVIADTDCELIEIPIPHLDRLLFQRPAWAMALLKTLSKRMKVANDQRTSD